VVICLPSSDFQEKLTGTIIFQSKMSRIDMVAFISGFQHSIGANWDDPCADSGESCGKRYVFSFHPPPVAGVYSLEILLLCNFNKNISMFERRKRLLYSGPVLTMGDNTLLQDRSRSYSKDLSLNEAFDELYVEKNVRRIFFIGDSHMRKLYEHSIFLLTRKARDFKMAIDVRVSHKSIELIYLKMEGIYDDGKFGCIGRGKFTGKTKFTPHHMEINDVVLVNDAHWTVAFCERDKYGAYRYYLPKFMDFFSVENQGKKVFITSPPWNPLYGGNSCKRRTNINLSWANQVGAFIARKKSWHVFDAWSLLMPLYNITCDPAHFSCLSQKKGEKKIYGSDIIVVKKLWNYLTTIS